MGKEGSVTAVGREATKKGGGLVPTVWLLEKRHKTSEGAKPSSDSQNLHLTLAASSLRCSQIPGPEKIQRRAGSGHCHHRRPGKMSLRQDDNGTIVAKGPSDGDVPLRLGTGQKL